jgi:hypothetical protein
LESGAQLKEISHNITKAGQAAQKEGLQLTNDDFELLTLIDSHDNVVRTRYVTTGAYTRPEEDALSAFCEYLDKTVGDRLIADGHPVRETIFRSRPTNEPATSMSDEGKQRKCELIREAREFVARATTKDGIGTDFKRKLEGYTPFLN